MASESETLADIVAEIRAYGAQPPPRLMWLEIADRIEAASRRECESVGNAAATREALETIHDKVNRLDEECGVDPVEIRDIARAALSAPARNCDAFPDEYDARKEWSRIGKCRECKEEILYCERCYGRWLFAPAAEQKGAGDGR